jgi:hypothetical protein
MQRHFDHIDLRVPRLAEVVAFYETLLPSLGFSLFPREGKAPVYCCENCRFRNTCKSCFSQSCLLMPGVNADGPQRRESKPTTPGY